MLSGPAAHRLGQAGAGRACTICATRAAISRSWRSPGPVSNLMLAVVAAVLLLAGHVVPESAGAAAVAGGLPVT